MQRDRHDEKETYRPFDVYNLGRYERQWWQQQALRGADEGHRKLVLKFFGAVSMSGNSRIHGRKGKALVHVSGIDSILTRDEAAEVARTVSAMGGTEVHCLAWDFEMDLPQVMKAIEAEHGVQIRLRRIPREIMEANRTGTLPFFEMGMLAAVPQVSQGNEGPEADIKLTQFIPSLAEVPTKELEALGERALRNGFDFIDFWAVDFDWTPRASFTHHWQSYRTRTDRALETVSNAGYRYAQHGTHTACVKVVDVFGCDTSITVEVKT